MSQFLMVSQVVISILLMVVVLVQNRDGGLSAFMGGGNSFETTRRGAEKVLYNATILLAVLFLLNAFAFVLV